MSDPDPLAATWDRLVDGAVQAALKAGERPETRGALDRLTALLGTTPEALESDPAAGRTAVGAALGRVAEVVRDAASPDADRRARASAALASLSDRLEALGLRPHVTEHVQAAARERLAVFSEDTSRRIQALLHPEGRPDATADAEADEPKPG